MSYEEKKEYTVVGKVEIGTDEYRDLIEAVKDSENSANEYRTKFWNEQAKVNELTEQVKTLTSFKEYVQEKCLDSYRLWKIEKAEGEVE